MSSVKRRIIIEEFESGGFGMSDNEGCEMMGLANELEVIETLILFLRRKD